MFEQWTIRLWVATSQSGKHTMLPSPSNTVDSGLESQTASLRHLWWTAPRRNLPASRLLCRILHWQKDREEMSHQACWITDLANGVKETAITIWGAVEEYLTNPIHRQLLPPAPSSPSLDPDGTSITRIPTGPFPQCPSNWHISHCTYFLSTQHQAIKCPATPAT